MAESNGLLNVRDAQSYCQGRYGVAPGRDWFYAQARTKVVPVVWIGKRRVYFPRSSIDTLMAGQAGR